MQPCECLTTKEMQVATLVWEGLTNRQIAAIIGASEQVVKNYLRTTFDKLVSGADWNWRSMWPGKGGAGWRDTRNLASESALQSDPSGVLPQSG